ncbi:dockerin type I domain-containing protein [Botrimarina hoheduenensis]|uniref:Beta-porphyranase A n=1 Tax=Botrimarina hoheduenensis TaxID=2528000 RepID=A0A5C5VPV3_9BACT|nr:dockerin type I domain-containing protein [Botrimarina hoheduenensis]TWT40636.1 Beta-porphyranase A precursor [Botrimarina hoheduenensis]
MDNRRSQAPRSAGGRLSGVAVTAALASVLSPSLATAQTTVTIDASARRLVGGVGELDRAKYFNYSGTLAPPVTSLRQSIWAEDGLNASTGRVATELDQFISSNLPEDPTRPGHVDPTALQAKIQGDYRNFVLTSARWEALREQPNPVFVQSGRNGGFFPDYLDGGGPMPTNYEAFADFMTVYLDEAVYGQNAFLPVDADRFYFEVMNEPNWSDSNQWGGIIEMHRVMAERVKEVFPQARIGGVSCCDDVEAGANSFELAKQVIDDMATWRTASGAKAELDFYTIHPYERYDVRPDGSHFRKIDHSPGHLNAIMDLYESYSFNVLGDPKQFAITEYGSWNRTDMADGSYGNYARDLQQWDLVRDVKEKMFVFFDRPDRIINATPFVSPRHWQNAIPTNPAGDNVFWEQNASGQWQETIVAGLFRLMAPVSGSYVAIESGSTDLQAVAFRDGAELHVLLNNLLQQPQAVDLDGLAAAFNIDSASWSRVYRDAGQNTYSSGVDVSSSWDSLTLEGEGAAVLTLQLDGSTVFDHAYDTETFYADQTQIDFTTGDFLSMGLDADTEDAVSAKLRVGYTTPFGSLPTFTVRVNNNATTVPGYDFDTAFDDGDESLFSRELEIPLSQLQDGANDLAFFFGASGANGQIVSAVLEVTRSVGDYSQSGRLDGKDLDALYARFGAAAEGDKHDLTADGQIDFADVTEWLGIRNASPGDVDIDGDRDTRDAVVVLANRGATGARPDWTRGNFDADADIDIDDVAAVLLGYTGDRGGATDEIGFDPQADNPDLVYDPATGRVQLAATGIEVLAISLAGAFTGEIDPTDLNAAVDAGVALIDDADGQKGWVSGLATSGQGAGEYELYDLGLLLPAGLDLAGLTASLDSAVWAGDGFGGSLDLVLTAALPGDFNDDGVVDSADYTVYRDTLASTTDLRADANRDGRITEADYQQWIANYGASAGSATAVPEPGGAALVAAITGLAWLAGRRADSRTEA